jgi:hypothetical protein
MPAFQGTTRRLEQAHRVGSSKLPAMNARSFEAVAAFIKEHRATTDR